MVILKNKNLMQKIRRVFLFAFFAITLLPAINSYAQTLPASEPDISFDVLPEFPLPESPVYISAQSLNTDLNRAVFTWKQNGSQLKSGVGVKNVSFKTGKIGSGTTITVKIQTLEGLLIEREFGFRPASVTLIAEAGSYVPPFYKGMPLLSRGGNSRIVAIPEFFNSKGVRLNPKTLTYTWKQNGDVIGEQSGYGKDSIALSFSSYSGKSDEISVEVFSKESGIAGSGLIPISFSENNVLLYEDMPSLGTMFNHVLNNSYTFNNKELTVVEVPMFISAGKATSPMLVTEWSINNSIVSSLNNKDRVTLPTSSPGRGSLSVTVRHKDKLLQGGDKAILITIPKPNE